MYSYRVIEHKRHVLQEQSSEDKGNYYKFLKAFYNVYLQKAKEQGRNYATDVSWKELMNTISTCDKNAFVSVNTARHYQTELRKLGYIQIKKIHGEWRYYITDELDF